ncbi:MAG: 3'-5' exonuclease [Bacteroidota bacterium]
MQQKSFQNPLFIDIETVPAVGHFDQLSASMQALWKKKAAILGYQTEEEQVTAYFEKAGIFAEFGKIVAIVVGYITPIDTGKNQLLIKSIAEHDEYILLSNFVSMIKCFPRSLNFCGHNIKEFDIPYLCRRMIVHDIALPSSLDIAGKKPWEVNHIDTLEMWKFGDRKAYTSLNLLAHLLGIPSSKESMDGSEVTHYYYTKQDLASITKYCIQDVIVTVQVYRKIAQLPLIDHDAVIITE